MGILKNIYVIWSDLYLTQRFFLGLGIIIALFLLAFPISFLFPLAQIFFFLFVIFFFTDIVLLFSKNIIVKVRRRLPKIFSLGDDNSIFLDIKNESSIQLDFEIIDEIPFQFQKRDFLLSFSLAVNEDKNLSYTVFPAKRGVYEFGNIIAFVSTFLGLAKRRFRKDANEEIAVYPSVLQMKRYTLLAFSQTSNQQGIKKIRRLGHSYEFEQIKNYVPGDDIRSINWKASSRRAALMVNQYEDERAQQVYNIIDKSRNMLMPFEELGLMDYAINTSLVISNVALQKHDKAGLITFSDKIGTTLKADRKTTQLNKILAALYNEKERNLEANYELLYYAVRKFIKGRSLIMLYTNFESSAALERVLPILRKINNQHLLVVVFFKNTEIENFSKMKVNTTEDIYHQTIAQKFLYEKEQMAHTLRQYGIQSVLTRPADLSINSINKYLELKARGLI